VNQAESNEQKRQVLDLLLEAWSQPDQRRRHLSALLRDLVLDREALFRLDDAQLLAAIRKFGDRL
jgi:hypothetical protein